MQARQAARRKLVRRAEGFAYYCEAGKGEVIFLCSDILYYTPHSETAPRRRLRQDTVEPENEERLVGPSANGSTRKRVCANLERHTRSRGTIQGSIDNR